MSDVETWQAFKNRKARREHQQRSEQTPAPPRRRRDMAGHFTREKQGSAWGVACEYERHGRVVKPKTRAASREKEETWQARETWATGALQTTAQTKEQTWQATHLPGHLLRKERQVALSRSLAVPQHRHGRPACRGHLTVRTSAVVAALSTPLLRNAAGASHRRRNRSGVISSSLHDYRALFGRCPARGTLQPVS
jgi:hypothetical protein